MIYGLLMFIAGAAMFCGTLAWIVHDLIKSRKYRINRSRKKQGYVIPPTTEMYEGIRIVDTE